MFYKTNFQIENKLSDLAPQFQVLESDSTISNLSSRDR